ncbi:MAG: DUF1064 domain-containing protein [Bacteroidetes bacterium]|nr:DUF1064 domain-containing protein [Bacteroidota bacterium]
MRKYRNIPVVIDGIRFDSKGEARRWGALRLQERAGLIDQLDRQVSFTLVEKTAQDRAVTYRVDFTYRKAGRLIAEDFKGYETKEFKLKAKLFRAKYPEYDLIITNSKGMNQ